LFRRCPIPPLLLLLLLPLNLQQWPVIWNIYRYSATAAAAVLQKLLLELHWPSSCVSI